MYNLSTLLFQIHYKLIAHKDNALVEWKLKFRDATIRFDMMVLIELLIIIAGRLVFGIKYH